MKCRQCGTEIAEKALICYRCGAAVAEPVFQPPAQLPAKRMPLLALVIGAAVALIAALSAVVVAC
jgi:hypothetical protein